MKRQRVPSGTKEQVSCARSVFRSSGALASFHRNPRLKPGGLLSVVPAGTLKSLIFRNALEKVCRYGLDRGTWVARGGPMNRAVGARLCSLSHLFLGRCPGNAPGWYDLAPLASSGAFNGNPPNSNAGFEPASFGGPKARNVPLSKNVQRPTLNLKTAIEPQINDHGRR